MQRLLASPRARRRSTTAHNGRAHRCLVLSPAAKFGSWGWLSDVMRHGSAESTYDVITFGRPDETPPRTKVYALPDINYVKWGSVMAERRFLVLNALLYVPAIPLIFAVALVRRPRHLVANGIAAAAMLLPLKLVSGAKLHLMYHGYISHFGRTWHRLIGLAMRGCDDVVVNSRGSAEDLASAIDSDRITVVEHWADPVFFERPLQAPARRRLRLLYVGRMNPDKFSQCLSVAKALTAEGVIEFWTVGDGPMRAELAALSHVVDHGYVGDKERLADIYQSVDVVWSPADVTYLSRPGIEALASGVPVVASDIPSIQGRTDRTRIPRDLVPEPCGWIVDGDSDDEAIERLRSLAADGVTEHVRQMCRAHAERRHSTENIDAVAAMLTD